MTQPQCIKIKIKFECCSSANTENSKRHRDHQQQQQQLDNLINSTMIFEVTTFLEPETRINWNRRANIDLHNTSAQKQMPVCIY